MPAWFSWLADDEERGAVRDWLVMCVDGLQLECHQLHVAARVDGGQPPGGPDAVARSDRTLKTEALLAVHEVGDVERHLLVGPQLPVGIEAVDHGVGWRRDQLAAVPRVAHGRHVVADRLLRDLVGHRFVAPADPARVGHYANSPWSFIASPMSPLTFSFCCMNAVTGFNLPVAMFIQSSVEAIRVVFGLCAGPWISSGAPLAILSVHDSPLRSNW